MEDLLRPGYRLDRYELLAPVASGGMASVWLARLRGKRGFEKLFAIKTIKTELESDARFQEMFLDEARIASGIVHPNVAQILDLGEQGDLLYIVMEWVDGESLAKIMKLARRANAPLPLGLSLRVVADACAGLHAAHELTDDQGHNLGVVHRDVSPHNVLVATSGAVKVIDFGVAKARNRRAGETGEGVVKGKVRFMSPEQVKGKGGVDRRSDIWAIGVCLHELVTGALPYDSDNDVLVIRALLEDQPPPPLPASIPEPVREILQHSLVRDPDERFSTAAAMRRAIETAIDRLGLVATNEDVADYLRETLPELASKRREIVTKAIAAADAKEPAPSLPAPDEVAFAPTIVSQPSSQGKLAPKKAKSDWRKEPTAKQRLEGRVTEDATGAAMEVAGLPKRRGGVLFGLALVAALGAGAWFVWPGAARIRARFDHRAAERAAPPPPPETSAAPVAAPIAAPPIDPVATTSSSALPVVHATPDGRRDASHRAASVDAATSAPLVEAGTPVVDAEEPY